MSEAIRTAVGATVEFELEAPHANDGNLYDRVLREVEIPLLCATLRHFKGNQSNVAATLGLNRATLRTKLRRYKINPRNYYR